MGEKLDLAKWFIQNWKTIFGLETTIIRECSKCDDIERRLINLEKKVPPNHPRLH